MEEVLGLGNLLTPEQIDDLFSDAPEEAEKQQDTSPANEEQQQEEKKETTTEENKVDAENLFDSSESVGSEEEHKEKEGAVSNEGDGTSPANFYSSWAKTFKVDGIFPDLEDSEIDKITTPEQFYEAVQKQIDAGLTEKQRRIDAYQSAGVEDSTIKDYEDTIAYLDSIKEEDLRNTDENSARIRRQLIYTDLVNKGYSQEEAKEEVSDIFDNGTDVKRAIKALGSNRDYFKKSYKQLLESAQAEAEKEKKALAEQQENLKKSILEDAKVFGEIEVDKNTRQKIYDNTSKPVYHDKEDGEYYTAIQQYEKENPVDFKKYVGLFFTLTDGFKNLDKLIKPQVKKEVKKGIRDLERTLSNTSRTSDGNLQFVSGVADDLEASPGRWTLDI